MNNIKRKNKIKIALIDVQNTESTTKQLLGFIIDWKLLHNFLKNNWRCEKVFFYSGVDEVGKPVDFLNIDNLRRRIEKVL